MPIIKSLPVKLIVAVVIMVALSLSIGSTILMQMDREEFTEAMMRETRRLSTTVLASLDRSMLEKDDRQTVETMTTLSNTRSVEHLMIVNRKGVIALSPRAQEKGTMLFVQGGICTVCHEGAKARQYLVIDSAKAGGGEVFRNLVPILNRDECNACHSEKFLGVLVCDVDATDLRVREASQIKRLIFLGLAMFAAIALSLFVVVNTMIRMPIKALIRGTKEMAKGNYEVRLPEKSGDELGLLAASFNQMADKVEQSRTMLEKWNINLEDEVDRRTDELRRSNQQLEEEKEKTISIVHSIVEGVLSVNREGIIVLANNQVAEIFGREEAALLELPLKDILRFSSGRFRNFEEIEEFMLVRDPWKEGLLGEVQQIQPHRRIYKVSRNRILGTRGEDKGWVFSFHDITREKEIDDIKTNLVAMVSHELRTPLTAIKGSLLLLAEGGLESQAEQEEFQNIALTNTDRLISLINNLLDLSKIESGSIFYEHGTFFLEPLMQRCLEIVSTFAKRNRVNLFLDVDENIKEVTGDASKIEQVVVNLLSNAIKFSPDGGDVKVCARIVGDDIVVSVADRGIGIPAQEMEKIFEKFYQVDMSPVRKIGGSGLGLSICKAIVEGHGGNIWVESQVDEGSTFSFSISRSRTKAAPGPARKAVITPGEHIPSRVLVVEDEMAVRRVLARYLEEKGFEVLQATSAKEALEMARTRRPDCITVDVMLPDLDGFDLTAVLKSDPVTTNIPIVFLTVVEGEGKARGLRLGAAAYFTKPVEYELVVDKIEAITRDLGLGKCAKQILLVDDEPDVLRSLAIFLEHKGYGVTCAGSGQEALESLDARLPDLVILDLRMPGISGYEVLRKIKRDPRAARLPIIVITASESDKSRVEVLGMGASAFMRKPIYPEDLQREIDRIIN